MDIEKNGGDFQRVSSVTDSSQQITFSWNNLTLLVQGSEARKGLCGTKIGSRAYKPNKNILKDGKHTILVKNWSDFIFIKYQTLT